MPYPHCIRNVYVFFLKMHKGKVFIPLYYSGHFDCRRYSYIVNNFLKKYGMFKNE